jgi:hypothetical protein
MLVAPAHTSRRVAGVALALCLGALAIFASSASASDYKNDIDGVDYALQLIALKQASHISARIGVKLTKLQSPQRPDRHQRDGEWPGEPRRADLRDRYQQALARAVLQI